MNESLSEALKEAYASAPSNVVMIHTLEINQTGVQAPVYIAQSRRDVIAKDENGQWRTFRPCGFQFSLPPANEEGYQSLNIAIDNVDRRVMAFITTGLSSKTTVKVIYRPYLNTDLATPQMDPVLVMYLKDVRITTFQVTGRATFMDVVNKKFPTDLYTRAHFPALG